MYTSTIGHRLVEGDHILVDRVKRDFIDPQRLPQVSPSRARLCASSEHRRVSWIPHHLVRLWREDSVIAKRQNPQQSSHVVIRNDGRAVNQEVAGGGLSPTPSDQPY